MCVKDVHITENCGVLENLQLGDVILTNREFNIHDIVGIYCAEVNLPPFTRGKKQLGKEEVDVSRNYLECVSKWKELLGL